MTKFRIMVGLATTALLASCGGGSGNAAAPQPPPPPPTGPPAVMAQQVYTQVSLSFPLALMQAPGDASRWFAVERAGRVSVFDNDPNATRSTFLNITARVDSSENESGLLGMAFHPDFANNGEVFLSYTRTAAPFESVISRFRSFDGNLTLDPSSEEILLTVLQDFRNHNGGNIVFGPDDYLYAGFGDGGSGGDPLQRAQDTMNLLGAIVRIDVNSGTPYAIPAENPFAQNAPCIQGFGGTSCPEIFAWGLRNPWRFTFDRQTGVLWAGDVGQASWEEVDRIEVGGNYGWDVREGAHCHEPPTGCSTVFIDPVTEYDHSVGVSITGGYVYRGTAITALQGFYVFADFSSGSIWAIPENSPTGTVPVEIADTALGIASFGEGVDGELYVVDFGSGSLYRIVESL